MFEQAVIADLAARGGELVVLLLLMSRQSSKMRAAIASVRAQVEALARSLGVELVTGVHVEQLKEKHAR